MAIAKKRPDCAVIFILKQGLDSQHRIYRRIRPMKTNKRFIKGIVAAAAKEDTVMPWARGARRAAFIAKRNSDEKLRKTA